VDVVVVVVLVVLAVLVVEPLFFNAVNSATALRSYSMPVPMISGTPSFLP
jgi:hypothetical protein